MSENDIPAGDIHPPEENLATIDLAIFQAKMLEGTQIPHPDPDLRRLTVIGIQTHIDMVQTFCSGGKDQVRGSGPGKSDQDGASIDCFHDPAQW